MGVGLNIGACGEESAFVFPGFGVTLVILQKI